MKIRHVLIPTDLSSDALRPCAPIEALAKALGARVTLLHVVPDLRLIAHAGVGLAPNVSIPDTAVEIQEAQSELERQALTLDADLEVTVEVLVAERTASAICEYARDRGVDLIALSTHGRSGLRRLALGSVAEAVVRHATMPVVAFPPPRE